MLEMINGILLIQYLLDKGYDQEVDLCDAGLAIEKKNKGWIL
jgi:hypothetical protein